MSLFDQLLKSGFFPKELPVPFTTATFGSTVARHRSSLPASFSDSRARAHLCAHNLARAGSLRRRLGIPNPILFSQLASLVADNWDDLRRHCLKSPYSTSAPVRDVNERRALIPGRFFADSDVQKVKSRGACRFLVKADVAACYPSIYTHSIPWALHTKAVAKRTRGAGLLGNEIDRAVRNAQDQQTVGIPIGPDTSLVVAEVVLAAIDRHMRKRFPRMRGIRLIDDYEIPAFTRTEAEDYLGSLQEFAARYELSLNPKKSGIIDLPQPTIPPWIHSLRMCRLRTSAEKQRIDLINLFDRVFEVARANPDTHVVQYALGRILNEDLHKANCDLLQSLIAQCLITEPGGLAPAYSIYDEMRHGGVDIDKDLLGETLNQLIQHQAPIRHSSEVAWSLWFACDFGIALDRQTTKALSRVDDDVVAITALDAHQRGLLHASFSPPSKWTDVMTEEGLMGPHWLLAYEAGVKAWLPSTGGGDHIAKNEAFAFLRDHGVSFYGILTPPTRSVWRAAALRKLRRRGRRSKVASTPSPVTRGSARTSLAELPEETWGGQYFGVF